MLASVSYLPRFVANWAQSSGEMAQNIAIPYLPAPATPHWSPRFGMATIVTSTTNLSSSAYIYVLGGDSYDGHNTRRNYQAGLLDYSWENGFKNDVWRTEGTEWYVKGDVRLKTKYHQKVPRVYSKLQWEQVSAGLRPSLGTTQDDWISCEAFFRNKNQAGSDCSSDTDRDVMWSPRRNHAGVYFKGYLWVMGGRAREFVDLTQQESVGGIIGQRIQDIPRTANNALQQFSTQREIALVKSDVWRSSDGATWELVTPGCKAPQASLVAASMTYYGIKSMACTKDNDCYGAEVCDATLKTCVCSIWSPREQHAVAAYGNYLYLTGGYASRLYSLVSACGDYACGDTQAGDYRYYLADVWRSADGESWTLITESAFSVTNDASYSSIFQTPRGRGGHSMLAFADSTGTPYLWVFGGRGGNNSVTGGDLVDYNDVWRAALAGTTPSPAAWRPVKVNDSYSMPWAGRRGLSVALDPSTTDNLETRTLYLYGGMSGNDTFYDDVWAWRLDNDDFWRLDYSTAELYGSGSGNDLAFYNNSPSIYYVSVDSPIEAMRRFWVPPKPGSGTGYQLREYITSDEIEQMQSVGVMTIEDLANAGLYVILKLRGFDIPQVPKSERLTVSKICDYRAFAKAIVNKCSNISRPDTYDGEWQMPWNVVPVFGGLAPLTDSVKWHGRKGYGFLRPETGTVEELIAEWDGCTYESAIQGLHGPNVNGIGYVTQVSGIRDPTPEVENLFCRQTPGPRAFHSLVPFEGRVYLLGGKQSDDHVVADAWYRDARMPRATIQSAPKDRSSNNWFHFTANEAGCYFEYRLWDAYGYKEIRPWTPVTKKTSVYWLNWREGGPGNGDYTLFVRAVDPSGNRDDLFIYGVNVYRWHYISPTPWDIIFGIVGAFIGLCLLAYLEYRRRVKKAAMERYAMKRMRRKFKAMQRDVEGRAVDWRTLYMESKQAEEMGKRERKKLKKTRDKNAEKREKEKKKREKEKELIKRKLRASKEHKTKSSSTSSKKEKEKSASGSSRATPSKRSQVMPSVTPDVLQAVPEGEDEEEDEMVKAKSVVKRKPSSRTAAAEAKVMAGDDDGEEKDTEPLLPDKETGFKARKVNKRLKAYEAGAGGKVAPDRDPNEEKEDINIFEKEFQSASKDKKGK
eukprot:gene8280-9129_t